MESRYVQVPEYFSPAGTSPASEFWGINESITYGTSTSILSTTAGIVDTGTTLLLLESEAYQTYMSLTGAVQDEATGLLTIAPEQFQSLKSLFFNIGGVRE